LWPYLPFYTGSWVTYYSPYHIPTYSSFSIPASRHHFCDPTYNLHEGRHEIIFARIKMLANSYARTKVLAYFIRFSLLTLPRHAQTAAFHSLPRAETHIRSYLTSFPFHLLTRTRVATSIFLKPPLSTHSTRSRVPLPSFHSFSTSSSQSPRKLRSPPLPSFWSFLVIFHSLAPRCSLLTARTKVLAILLRRAKALLLILTFVQALTRFNRSHYVVVAVA